MDPVKYSRALKLTYSRLLSPEEVKPFLDAHYAGDHNALGVLKDKFQDEGDPRGDIWDRAEGLTTVENWKDHKNDGLTTGPTDLRIRPPYFESGGSSYSFHPVVEGMDGPYKGDVKPTHTRATFMLPNGTGRRAVFTPAEARQLADKFPAPHSEQIHAFLDTHFPDTKRPTE